MMAGTTLEERVDIFESAEKGEASWRTARRLRICQRTVQKWRRRGRLYGRAGLHSQLGRPKTGSLSSYPAEMSDAIRRWRRENPGWGADTLRAELALHGAFQGEKLPSRATIARFLKEEGFIAEREPAVDLPNDLSGQVDHAHQLWELDARGHELIPDVGMVTLINLNERFTHARLLSYPCWLGQSRVERHATTEDYQACLRLTFMEWGLPEAIQCDHESVFYDNTTRSPFPTRFHLWLVALGVSMTLIRVHQPRDQGMTERSHQLWHQQVVQGHTFADWTALYSALEKRRSFLNHNLPCRTLGDRPPLVAHPEATHSGRHYHLGVEAELLDLDRVFRYLARGHWFRRISQSGTVSLGRQIYYIGSRCKRQQAEITFDLHSHQLRFVNEAGELISAKPIKGITKEMLMGDVADLSLLPACQMCLPFDWSLQQNARLFETIL
jgi:hypothetical protein